VLFTAVTRVGSAEIFTSRKGTLRTIADTSTFQAGLGSPVINAAGTVAFPAGFSATNQGIFTGNGGPLTTVADTTGMFSSLFAE